MSNASVCSSNNKNEREEITMKKNMQMNFHEKVCPECGGQLHEKIDMYINECDRCLAEKVE